MKKLIYFCLILHSSVLAQSVAINTSGAVGAASSRMDVQSTNLGICVPRIALSGKNDVASVPSSATSLMIYNTATANSGADFVFPGYYYWISPRWVRMLDDYSAWYTFGNYQTDPATHFIGTLDNQYLVFRTNTIEKLHLLQNGRLEPRNLGSSILVGNIEANDDLLTRFNLYLGFDHAGNSTGNQNVVIGNKNRFNAGSQVVAIGDSADATQQYTVAIGQRARATNSNGIALGKNSRANGSQSLSIGRYSFAGAIDALAIGDSAIANASNSIAIGRKSFGGSSESVTIGFQTATTGNLSIILGTNITISTVQSIGIGNNAIPTGNRGIAIGLNTRAGLNSVAIGNGATTIGFGNSIALGTGTTVTANNQVRIGNTAITSIGGQVGWTTISDKRFKTNIQENIPGINFIKSLNPVTYNYDFEKLNTFLENSLSQKESNIIYSGFLAQDVEKSALSMGYVFSGIDRPKNNQDYYGIRYEEFVVPLVKTMQEQQEILGQINMKLILLREQNEMLKALIKE